jgi:hypothetical protein
MEEKEKKRTEVLIKFWKRKTERIESCLMKKKLKEI